jgi:hypothetical protein
MAHKHVPDRARLGGGGGNLKHPLSNVALFGPLLLLQKQGLCDRIFLFQNSFSQNGENLSQDKINHAS